MLNPDQLWQRVLADLQINLTAPIYRTYLARTTCLSISDNIVTVGCPNNISVAQLNTKYRPIIEQTINAITKQPMEAKFVLHKNQPTSSTTSLFDQLPEESISDSSSTSPTPSTLPLPTPVNTQLNPSYTFDQFVVGKTNRVAHAAALAVTDNPGKNYNPFFLYGGTGVGKTHLVQAIGNALITKNPQTKVIYCSIERFMNDFIESMRFNTTNEFKKKYRSCDVLIVDDIQFITGNKQSTQEEFFHTFNELHGSGHQIILCSDRPPRELDGLTDRLVSRFEGGLSVDIAQPDFETKAAIIQAKAAHLNLALTPEIVQFIAEQDTESVRALEGNMLKLQTLVLTSNQPLTLASVQEFFGLTPTITPTASIVIQRNPNTLLKLICEDFGITLKDLLGKKRTKNLVIPRQLAMYVLRNDLDLNLETIGQLLGRDHTTVMHGIDKVARSINTDQQLRSSLDNIRQTATK